jgi:hypothetical protein
MSVVVVISVLYSVTVEPGTAVPVKVGVFAEVIPSVLEVPVSNPALKTGLDGVGVWVMRMPLSNALLSISVLHRSDRFVKTPLC